MTIRFRLFVAVLCCGLGPATIAHAQDQRPLVHPSDFQPQIWLSASLGFAAREGTMVSSEQRAALLAEGGVRWRWFGAALGDLYLGDPLENLFLDVSLGPESLAASIGAGWRTPEVIYEGVDSGLSPYWRYSRMGLRSRLPLGATGFTTDLRVALYRGMHPDEDVTDPRVDDDAVLRPRGHGREFESALEYSVRSQPFFVRFGYRIEVMQIDVGNEFDPGTEATHTLFVGGGYRSRSARR